MKGRALSSLLALAVTGVVLASTGTAQPAERFRVGIVIGSTGVKYPIGGLMRDGLERAVRELGVEGTVLTSGAREGSLPTFLSLARKRYDLVIGFESEFRAIDEAAQRFPKVRFVLVSIPHEALPHRPKNVSAVVFAEQEVGYLAGYLAALMEKRRPGKDVISSVGGFKYASVDRFVAGYQAGAKKASPGVTLLNAYANEFLDQAKCRRAALAQIAKGSGVVFPVAGDCGFGALEAAKEKGVFGIGVDIDQSSLGPHILTSAVKRFDSAVFEAIKEAKSGRFEGGRTKVLRLRDGALGLGKISPKVPPALVARVERIKRQIVSGKIRNIPTTVR